MHLRFLAVIALASAAGFARADDSPDLSPAIDKLAAAVREAVGKDGQKAVRIGTFQPVGAGEADYGADIAQALATTLGNLVKTDAVLEVGGNFGVIETDGARSLRIVARLTNTASLTELDTIQPPDVPFRKTVVVVPPPARGKKDLPFVANRLVELIRPALEKANARGVRIAAFRTPNPTDAPIGIAVTDALRHAFGNQVAKNADYDVGGTCEIEDHQYDRKTVLRAIRVKARLTDARTGEDVARYDADDLVVVDTTTIALLRGVTAKLDPNPDTEDGSLAGRNAEVEKQAADKTRKPPKIDGTKVVGPSGKYALEILVAGKARKPSVRDGLAFVDLKKDEAYEVRIDNRSPEEVACAVVVDGLNSFAFAEPAGQRSHWIVPAGKTATIAGWLRSVERGRGEDVAPFLAVPTDPAVTARFAGAKPNVPGLIAVSFSKTAKAGDDLATYTPVNPGVAKDKRQIDVIHEVISIRVNR